MSNRDNSILDISTIPTGFQWVLCFSGAQNKTRTCTSLRSLVPETSVSTNFTIWANKALQIYTFQRKTKNATPKKILSYEL